MNTATRFIYLHGNSTTHWSFGWAPWLKRELEALGHETFFETLPDSVIARSRYWLPFLSDHVGAGENDVLIGWSSGATAAMRYAESHQLRGSILIAPSHTDLGDDLEKQSGYFDEPWRWPEIRAHQREIALVWGDDDPYIPQEEFAFIARQLQPVTFEIPGGGHFTEQETFPEVLRHIRQSF